MTKKTEIELLIARYKADISALEDRKDDLMRQIEILENIVPIVLVWSMSNIPYSPETPSPEHEIQKAKENLAHFEGVLEELKQAVKLINEEEQIIRKRIDELEEKLTDRLKQYPAKPIDESVTTPEKPVTVDVMSEKEKLQVEGLKDDKVKFDEDTDWKKVCEDLLKQVSELNTNLKNSSQQLKESESHAKRLEKEYSRLEKELQEKIKLLEAKSDTSVSEIVDKEQEKYSREEIESKEVLSAMEEALAEVRSMKDSLSKSRTLSKDDHIEPLDKVTDFEDSTAALKDVPSTEKSVTVDVTSEKENLQAEGLKDDKVKFDENTDWKKVCEDVLKQVSELSEDLKNSSQELRESESYAKRLEKEYSKLEKELQEKIKSLKTKSDTLVSQIIDKEREKYLKEECESKEALSAMQDALEEVRSMKESLSKYRTLNKDGRIEPLEKDTDVEDSTAALKDVPSPETPVTVDVTSQKEKLQIEGLKDDKAEFDEDTDWKKVCEDLLKQVSELSENLKNSSQQLRETESYAKRLEKEYSRLEKELQEKINLLETKSDTLNSDEIDGKDQEKYLQEELKSKEALSAMQDALEEVRSMKESLSKSRTLSKDDHIEPLDKVTDAQIFPKEKQKQKLLKHDTEKSVVDSLQTTISKKTVSEKAEGKTLTTDISDHHDFAQISDEAETSLEDIVAPSKTLASKPENRLPVKEPSVDPATTQMSSESETTSKRMVGPLRALASKDSDHVEGHLPLSDTKVFPDTAQITKEAETISEGIVTPSKALSSTEVPVLKDTQINTTLAKRKEIEMLIARYKADIAALEERKVHLKGQIDVVENLVPTVFLWYMSKVYQGTEIPSEQGISFPQHEVEEETKEKLERLKSDLGELQQSVELVEEEQKIIGKRIEKLETFLPDQFDKYPDEVIDISIPSIKHKKEKEDLKIKGLDGERVDFEEQLQAKDTDLKKMCEDLLKQVSELSENLKNSSQKLKESEDYVKHLEEEYSKLEKELQEKMKLLEKRTGLLLSEVDGKEPKQYSQEELESKEVLSAMEEALAEVRSMKESLSKSRTSSKEEPLIDDQDLTTMHKETLETQKELENIIPQHDALLTAEDISPKESVVKEPALPEAKKSKATVIESVEGQLTETKTSAVSETAKISLTESQLPERETESVPEITDISPIAVDTAEDKTPPSEETAVKDDILESVKDGKVPESEKPVVSDTDHEVEATTEDVSLKSDTSVAKDKVCEPAESKLPEKETEAVPEISDISPVAADTAEDKAPPSEATAVKDDILESVQDGKEPESEKPVVSDTDHDVEATTEDVSLKSDTSVAKDKVCEPAESKLPEKETEAVPEISDISPVAADTAEDKAPPSEATAVKDGILESVKDGKVPESEKPVVSDTDHEVEATTEDVSLKSDTSVAKDKVCEPAESKLPEKETEAVPEISDISPVAADTAEDKAHPSEATVVKDDILESVKDGKVPDSEKPVVSDTDHEVEATTEDVSLKSDRSVAKDKVCEPAESKLPEKETEAVPEISDISPVAADTAEDKAPPSEATAVKDDILESVQDGKVPESEKPVVSDTDHEVEATTEDVSLKSDTSVAKDKVCEPAESKLPEKETEAVPEISDISPVAADTAEDKAPTSPQTVVDVKKPSGEVVTPMEKARDSPTAGEPVPSDRSDAQTTVPKPTEATPTDTSPRPEPSGDKAPELTTKRESIHTVQEPALKTKMPSLHTIQEPGLPTKRQSIHTVQEPGLATKRPSIHSLTGQTLQSKLLVKDHLIKSMADQLRELAHDNKWPGRRTFEEATSADPVKTYDFDKNTLLLYLKGEEPQDFAESMRSNKEYSSSNPLNVKIVRKVDKDSLMIEWGPPPSAEVVGFQIYVNGQFMYWVHSAKRNLALLHPLDLKLLLDIAVSPINIKGEIVSRSSVTYKPE